LYREKHLQVQKQNNTSEIPTQSYLLKIVHSVYRDTHNILKKLDDGSEDLDKEFYILFQMGFRTQSY